MRWSIGVHVSVQHALLLVDLEHAAMLVVSSSKAFCGTVDTADDFSTTISSDKMTDELDESELPSYATSMHSSTPSPSPIPNLSTSNQSLSIMHEMALTRANDDTRNCMSRAIRESG